MKPADKQLVSLSSVSVTLDEIPSIPTKQLLLHFTLPKFVQQLMRFPGFAWCIQKWRNIWKLLQHVASICSKISREFEVIAG